MHRSLARALVCDLPYRAMVDSQETISLQGWCLPGGFYYRGDLGPCGGLDRVEGGRVTQSASFMDSVNQRRPRSD